MRKIFLLVSIIFIAASSCFAANYIKVEPQFLTSVQTKDYEQINETLAIVFSKIRSEISTKKYPKYYHDFTLIKDDGTQSKAFHYVKYGNAELIYTNDTNELKYVSFRRPELQKCRIIYDYPAGKLYAVQIFISDNDYYIFGSDGKYVDYTPYVKEVKEKVIKSWRVPPRMKIDVLARGQKDLLVQMAVTVGKDGQVKKCRILKSSKIKELDDNAGAAIKAAAPFKPFPQNFFNEELVITLNFNFSL